MRRLFGGVFLSLSVVVMGAAPPASSQSSPTPRPIVTAAPVLPGATAAPKAAYAPNVVVYPFDQTGQMDPTVGRSIAQIFSQVFAEAGNLTVQPVPANAKRADFLTNARNTKADFYVSGYVTPIGNGAAIVEQVVKVSSGVIIYSQTQTVYSVPDATSLALGTHNVILQAAGVNIDVTPQPRATAAGAENSTANGAQVNLGGLGGVLQNIFHGRGKPATGGAVASAQATPVSRPTRGIIVAKVTGSSGDAANATGELTRRLAVNYNVTQGSAASTALPGAADTLCATNRNNTIAAGTLDTEGSGRRGSATFTLKIYTCFGSVLFTNTQQNADWHKAVDAAVAEYVKSNPGNS